MLPPHTKEADDVEVFHSSVSSLSLTFSGGQTKTRERHGDSGYGIRALKGGRVGFSYCERQGDIGRALKNALKSSRFSPQTGFSFPGKSRLPAVNAHDAKVGGMGAEELKSLLDRVRENAERYSSLSRVMVSAEKAGTAIENTRGFRGECRNTVLSVYTEVMDGNGMGMAYHAANSLPADPEALGTRAADMARRMRHPKKLPSGKYAVVVGVDAISPFLDVLLPSFSGDWERRNVSVLCGKLGRHLFDGSFTLAEDGTHAGVDARPFDDEGVPSKRRLLVDRGKVSGFYYDLETAALAGKSRDGRACGGCNRTDYSAPPSGGLSNIVISPGDYGDPEQELRNCLIVHSMHGSHTANLTTGDFGMEVSIAFLKKGEETIPVRGFMLVGNIFRLFSSIEGIGKKQDTLGNLTCPRIAFSGVRAVS